MKLCKKRKMNKQSNPETIVNEVTIETKIKTNAASI